MALRNRIRIPGRKVYAAVIAPLAVAGLLTAASVAVADSAIAASAPAWSLTASPNPTIPGDSLSAVSCPNGTHCVAVGSSVTGTGASVPIVKSWSEHIWTRQHVPVPVGASDPRLNSIACTSGRFCLAVGQYYPRASAQNSAQLVERWNGTSWRIVLSKGAGDLNAVSCSAYNACTAVGGTNVDPGSYDSVPVAERWNGRSFAAQRAPPRTPASGIELTGVACTSARSCITVGTNYNFGEVTSTVSARWNGQRWTAVAIDPGVSRDSAESGFAGLSCNSSSACTAPGYSVDPGGDPDFSVAWAERWNGHQWTPQTMPGSVVGAELAGPGGVACPTATSCLMVINNQTLQWSQTGWAIVTTAQVPAEGTLDGLSCSSVSQCTAVGSITGPSGAQVTLAERWTGSTWTQQPTPNNPKGGQPNAFNAVSCLARTDCIAVGTTGHGLLAAGWNGVQWQLQEPVPPSGATSASLHAVSCAAATCVAVGSATATDGTKTALAEQWNGSAWSLLTAPADASALSAISCTAATACEAVGASASGPTADSWDGTAWTSQTLAAGPATLSAVSCSAASSCMAVGDNGSAAAEYWDGTSWSLQSGMAGKPLKAVSCPTATDCTATGLDGTIDSWNGTTWSAKKSAATRAADLDGISCVSASACTATGGYESNAPFLVPLLVEHWNGASWTVQAAPVPASSEGDWLVGVSCTSSTACVAVGGRYDPYRLLQTVAERYA